MKQILTLMIAALSVLAIPSCSKSESSGKVDLEYTVWNAMTSSGNRESLHFKEGWCKWTTYFGNSQSNQVTTEWRYKVSGTTITLYLDNISQTATYNEGSKTITMVVTGETLTFTRS